MRASRSARRLRPVRQTRVRQPLRVARLLRRTAAAVLVVLTLSLVAAPAASAHPLGNFSVNSYSGLRVEPDAVAVDLVVDSAEIPTLQAFPQTAGGGSVDAGTAAAYRQRECDTLARAIVLEVDGRAVELQVTGGSLDFPAGTAGLATMRLSCALRTAEAVETVGRALRYRDDAAQGRTGWREITAVGDGTVLSGSTVPERSVSGVLTAYPEDLLSSPLDAREATLQVRAGSGVAAGAAGAPAAPTDAVNRGVDRLTTAYTDLVARERLTLGFGLLAIVLAAGLGALHAFAPGHGKALMAASLLGRDSSGRSASSARSALLIALSVTVTHTAGVLSLGLLLAVTTRLAPERVYPWLGLASGLLLVSIGATLLRGGLSGRHEHSHGPGLSHSHAPAGGHDDAHDHGHDHGHNHGQSRGSHDHRGHDRGSHDHPGHDRALAQSPALAHATAPLPHHGHMDGHSHAHADAHGHAPADGHSHAAGHSASHSHDHLPAGTHEHGDGHSHEPPARTGWRGLLTIGFAGGLVPSPSALLVLLGGIALGRAWLGVLLVLAYGAGMAGALVGAGLLVVASRDRLTRWSAARGSDRAERWPGRVIALGRWLPAATAAVVVVLGVSVVVRSVAAIIA